MPTTHKLKFKTQFAIYVVGRSKISHVYNKVYDSMILVSYLDLRLEATNTICSLGG
jgi:hypothetical protein